MKIFSCREGYGLAGEVAKILGQPLGKITLNEFNSGEVQVILDESVRKESVYIIQKFSKHINSELMELLLTCDAMNRSSAAEITAILPFFPYCRQEKMQKREPISARVVASMLEHVAKVKSIMTMDLHAKAIQGFFTIPCDNLTASKLLADELQKHIQIEKAIVVSPDVGGASRARDFASLLGLETAIIEKKRNTEGVKVLNVIGDVDGKDAILLDDMIDTGGTTIKGANLLKEKGANHIFAAATFPVLSKGKDALNDSQIEQFFTTDAISQQNLGEKWHVTQIAPLIAEAIKRQEEGASISELF